MTTSRTGSTGRVRRALIITAAAVGVGVGVLPGTAHAAATIQFPTLGISQGSCPANYKQVSMNAFVPMSQQDAQRFINNPGSEVQIRLMGDDWRDDVEHGPVDPETTYYDGQRFGLAFNWIKCAHHSVLNEDPTPGDGDELYARFTFRDIRDNTTTTRNSSVVRGRY